MLSCLTSGSTKHLFHVKRLVGKLCGSQHRCSLMMKKFYSTPPPIIKRNVVDDLFFIKNLLTDSTSTNSSNSSNSNYNVDLKPTGLGYDLLPIQYALLSRLGLAHDQLYALPESLATLALQHPSRYPDNAFFETLLFYGNTPIFLLPFISFFLTIYDLSRYSWHSISCQRVPFLQISKFAGLRFRKRHRIFRQSKLLEQFFYKICCIFCYFLFCTLTLFLYLYVTLNFCLFLG